MNPSDIQESCDRFGKTLVELNFEYYKEMKHHAEQVCVPVCDLIEITFFSVLAVTYFMLTYFILVRLLVETHLLFYLLRRLTALWEM